MRVRPGLFLTLLLLHATPAHLAGQRLTPAVPVPPPPHRAILTRTEGIVLSLGLLAAIAADPAVHRGLGDADEDHVVTRAGNALGNPAFALPALGLLTLSGVVTHNDEVKRTGLHGAVAGVLALGIAQSIRVALGRERPDVRGESDQFHPVTSVFKDTGSFPSGHVTMISAMATSVAIHAKRPWVTAAAAGAVGLTSFARIRDDRHWLSDVVAGAAIGAISSRLVDRFTRLGPQPVVTAQGVGLGFRF